VNAKKLLEYTRIKARVQHHLDQVALRLELGTARVDLEPQIELLQLLVDNARALSGGTLETRAWGIKTQELAAAVAAKPHLQLVR